MKNLSVSCAAVLLLLAAAGCTSTAPSGETARRGTTSRPSRKPLPPIPPLVIGQNSDGDVTIQWKSQPGFVYTVYYQAAPGGDWIALRGAERLPGTGGLLSVRDHVDPRKPPRRYRLLPQPARP